MKLVIDASIFVAAMRAPETNHARSVNFLQRTEQDEANLYCPTIVLAECSAAISRQTDDAELTERTVTYIAELPRLFLVTIDIALAKRAADIAKNYRLRGADSIYVAVARLFDATLITWDNEMLERGGKVVQTMTPTQWLEQNQPTQSEEPQVKKDET